MAGPKKLRNTEIWWLQPWDMDLRRKNRKNSFKLRGTEGYFFTYSKKKPIQRELSWESGIYLSIYPPAISWGSIKPWGCLNKYLELDKTNAKIFRQRSRTACVWHLRQCDMKLTLKTHPRWACRHARDGFRFGTELAFRQYTKGDVLTHRICAVERKNHTPTCKS